MATRNYFRFLPGNKGHHIIKLIAGVASLCLLLLLQAAHADADLIKREDFQAFLNKMTKVHNFDKKKLEDLFLLVKLRPDVIKSMNKPLEKQAWHTYQRLFVNEWRIEHGVQFWNKHAELLKKAETTFGVPASIIVATIGIETKYGKRLGGYRAIDSLSSLAFSTSSRAAYFRKELEEFLLLTREQKLDPLKIMGSYAGAIGQPQFMPSSYRHYAVNFSKSGSTDLIHDIADVIGSIANYYKVHGWQANEPITSQVMLVSKRFEYFSRRHDLAHAYTIKELVQSGLVPKEKYKRSDKAKVIVFEKLTGSEYWLGFHNFDVIKRYNRSNHYAMAIYQLSFYMTKLRERFKNGEAS